LKLEAIELSKDVLLFKNVLKDKEKLYKFVLDSKTNQDPYFGNWEDWRPWGQYSKAEPRITESWKTHNSEGAEVLRECIDIFFNVLKIYKENYFNNEYFELHSYNKNIPTSLEELEAGHKLDPSNCFQMADVVILESENTEASKKLSMDYHQDRRFWFGSLPHIFNFNIYVNDDYEGGAIKFINTHKAEKKTYKDSYSGKEGTYLLVDDFFEYRMDAGDAMLFRTDHYHAVDPVKGNKFYIRQFLSYSHSEEYLKKEAEFINDDEWKNFLKEKEKEGFEKRESMILFDNEECINLDGPMFEGWHGVLVPCVLRNKSVD
jgi:hypothetical protein